MKKMYEFLCACVGKEKALRTVLYLTIIQCAGDEDEYITLKIKLNNLLTLSGFYIQTESVSDMVRVRSKVLEFYTLLKAKMEREYLENTLLEELSPTMAITSLQ